MKNIIRQLLVFFVFVVSLNLAAQTLPVITGQGLYAFSRSERDVELRM